MAQYYTVYESSLKGGVNLASYGCYVFTNSVNMAIIWHLYGANK